MKDGFFSVFCKALMKYIYFIYNSLINYSYFICFLEGFVRLNDFSDYSMWTNYKNKKAISIGYNSH